MKNVSKIIKKTLNEEMNTMYDMSEFSYNSITREDIINALEDAVENYSGSIEYDLGDNGSYWEYGTIYSDFIIVHNEDNPRGKKYLIDEIETDIL